MKEQKAICCCKKCWNWIQSSTSWYLWTLVENLRIPSTRLTKLYCDNNAIINIAHNLVQHDRTKHVEVDHHFIKEKMEVRLVCMPCISTKKQLADVLTKGVHKEMFNCIINKCQMWTNLWGSVEDFRSLGISFILF